MFNSESDISKKIVIYGAGWAGRTVCIYLMNHEIPVTAFVVTARRNMREQNGIPVYCLDDFLSLNRIEDTVFILSVTKLHRHTMQAELEKRGVCTYVVCPEDLLYGMARENRRYAARKAEICKEKSRDLLTVGYLSPGYLDSDYAERRLIIDKIAGISYLAIPKETADITYISSEYEDRMDRYRGLEEASYCPDQYLPEVDLIHTFNTVCQTDKPWCASFETVIPRMNCDTQWEKDYYLQLVECMKRPNCRALYALCRNAYEIQRNMLKETLDSPADLELLMSKTKVLHPPQEVLITEEAFEEKHKTKKIHFIFVGGAFFIKGGREVIETLSEFEDRYDFDLTLISSLLYDDYFTKTSYEEMVRCRRIIHDCEWIDYYESLDNRDVLEKCKEATIGLLPSVADTYGYAVLEMQAAGCPVITTNVRAFSETNNEHCGWVCQLPVDELGFCMEQDSRVWPDMLKLELRRCFEDIFTHPENIEEKGRNALERIREMHNPYKYQEELRSVVEECYDKGFNRNTSI